MLKEKRCSETTQNKFVPLLNFLISHEEERESFFENPESFVKEFKLVLSAEDCSRIRQIFSLDLDKKYKFDEKLVLCSASGY